MPANQCKINEIIKLENNFLSPIITHFENGSINSENEQIDWHLGKKNDDKNSKVLIACTPTNLYYGTVGEGFSSNLVNTFIAIRNKTTNKMRLIQVEETSMINNVYDTQHESASKSISTLSKEFGGKKRQRVVDKKEKTKLNMDVVQNQLDMTLQAVKVENQLEEEIPDIRDILPKKNTEATDIKHLYNLEDLIPPKVLAKLAKFADMVLKADINDLNIEYYSVKTIVEETLKSKTPASEANLNKLKSCLYIDGLMNLLLKFNTKSIITDDIVISDTKPVDIDLKERFFLEGKQRRISQYTSHKALTHLIILLLLQSNKYELDIDLLTEDTKIPKSKIVMFGQMVGAFPRNARNSVLALTMRKGNKLPFIKSLKR